jgi:AMMECR1 domain-containing protein
VQHKERQQELLVECQVLQQLRASKESLSELVDVVKLGVRGVS